MAIKVTVGEQKTQEELSFPKLMVIKGGLNYVGRVVLFTQNGRGTVVKPSEGDYKAIGYYSDAWIMESFVDYNEPLTLQNA